MSPIPTFTPPLVLRHSFFNPTPRTVSTPLRVTAPSLTHGTRAALQPPPSTHPSPTPATSTPWNPNSWRRFPILQQPAYPDEAALKSVEARLAQNPPLVFPGEIRRLRNQLVQAGRGKSFVLQGGDCAESFDQFSAQTVEATFRVLVAQVIAMSYLSGLPICKIGRVAGQFAKPRSNDLERMEDGGEIPVFRGDIINSVEKNLEARIPDPTRLLRAYAQSAASLNMLRALAKSSESMMDWVALIGRLAPERYGGFVENIEDALAFLSACGVDVSSSVEGLQNLREPEFYSSHEALLLIYEAALTREFGWGDDGEKRWYSASGHMLWVGERTRQLDGAHLEFLRGIENPIGVKVGPTMKGEELLELLRILNPRNEEGKIMLIVRMGCDKIQDGLPPLLRAVKHSGCHVVWSIDPMHGNTIKVGNGIKTRPFEKILAEVDAFFAAHEEVGTIPGGIHLEMTGEEQVTECLGGQVNEVTEERLVENYKSTCDPRLNGTQSIEMAFEVGNRLRKIAKMRRRSA
eukprot:GFKZ01003616.1.p1 GENE.GFKZ01003616.1~~GFKZ01003616.1.p1  ORF type:complete len:519 (+),score=85.95 GFKZ01003616.1:277-1833(+)